MPGIVGAAAGSERASETTAQTPRPTAATPVAIASAASVGQDGFRGGSTLIGGKRLDDACRRRRLGRFVRVLCRDELDGGRVAHATEDRAAG